MEQMLKGYYFSQIEKSGLGPRDKVLSQIRTFQKAGINLKLVESPFCTEGKIRGNFILRQLVCRLPFTYVYSKHLYQSEYQDADIFYIRFLAGDWYFTRFIKRLRKNNPQAIIIMELADYPTTWYMTVSKLYTILYLPIIIKDIMARKNYRKYVDRIAILKPKKEVFGIPAIQFSNGVDIERIVPRTPVLQHKPIMIAVAAMCNFHGYDRLIEGIYQYYRSGGTREFELHLVGGTEDPGRDLRKYKDLCKQYNLERTVIFHGEKVGSELDEIYDCCNMAVASLGMYRIGYQTANSLKIREYLAKGLPVVTGCDIDIFQKNHFSFYYQAENNDTAINMAEVIDFFDQVYYDQNRFREVNGDIRAYAEKYCDMAHAFKSVIDYIKETSGKESGW